jgi:hypothetical protein
MTSKGKNCKQLQTTVLLSSASVYVSPAYSTFCKKVTSFSDAMLWRQTAHTRESFVLFMGDENFVAPLHKLFIGSIIKTKHSPGTPRYGAVPYVS